MKTPKFTSAAILALLGVGFVAHAETYEGVHPTVSANDRSTVRAEAVSAAHSGGHADAVSARVAPRLVAPADRSLLRAEAVAAARLPNPYAEGFGQGVASLTFGTGVLAVRAQ